MAENTQGTDTPTDASTAPSTAAVTVPDKPALEGLEEKLTARWAEEGVYACLLYTSPSPRDS